VQNALDKATAPGTYQLITQATALSTMEGVQISAQEFQDIEGNVYPDIGFEDLWNQDLPNKSVTFTKN